MSVVTEVNATMFSCRLATESNTVESNCRALMPRHCPATRIATTCSFFRKGVANVCAASTFYNVLVAVNSDDGLAVGDFSCICEGIVATPFALPICTPTGDTLCSRDRMIRNRDLNFGAMVLPHRFAWEGATLRRCGLNAHSSVRPPQRAERTEYDRGLGADERPRVG